MIKPLFDPDSMIGTRITPGRKPADPDCKMCNGTGELKQFPSGMKVPPGIACPCLCDFKNAKVEKFKRGTIQVELTA